jgi:hypothetical protein
MWKPRATALELARRSYKGPNKQQKWEYLCKLCNLWFKAKDVCVDHSPVAAGSIKSVEDIGAFANNLFCETDNLRVLCSPCHSTHTIADKMGISFAEAVIEQEIIAICNKSVKEIVDFCKDYEYTDGQLSNKDKRRLAVTEILKGTA